MPFPWAAAATVAGALISSRSQRSANDNNAALQREFAQHGIRWKVADAKAAGLHPLYAIGAVTPAAQASYQSSPLGEGIAQAGQAYEASLSRTADRGERSAANRSNSMHNARLRQMAMDRHMLEQQRLQSQIRVDNAEINYKNALAAAARADANNQSDGATSIEGIRSEDVPPVTGVYKPKPPEVPIASSKDRSMRAGPPAPAFQDVIVIDDKRVPEPLRRLRVPYSDEGPFEEFLEKLPVIAAANYLRSAGFLTSGSDIANYMTPYGRVFLLKKAIETGGAKFKAFLAAVMDKGRKKRKGPDHLRYGP